MNRQTQKITALYSRLSRDDEGAGESGSILSEMPMVATPCTYDIMIATQSLYRAHTPLLAACA